MEQEPPIYTWEVDQQKSADHWLEVKDPEGWRSAIVKWDGCVDYYRYYNTPKGLDPKNDEESCYIHLCSLDEEIARLQALKALAIKYFTEHGYGGDWQP